MIDGHDSNIYKMRSLLDQLERWESHICAALHHGNNTHTFDDIVSMIMTNRILFFSFDDAFVIMEKIDYPQFSVFHCFLAGGDMQAVIDAQESMSKIGKECGCKYLSIAGRDGWLRVLKTRGWKHVCTTMYTPIEDQDNEWRKGRGAETDDRTARRN